MRAIVVRETGSLDALVFEGLPDPEPSVGEGAMKVSALGVSGGDVNQTQPGEPAPSSHHFIINPSPLAAQRTRPLVPG